MPQSRSVYYLLYIIYSPSAVLLSTLAISKTSSSTPVAHPHWIIPFTCNSHNMEQKIPPRICSKVPFSRTALSGNNRSDILPLHSRLIIRNSFLTRLHPNHLNSKNVHSLVEEECFTTLKKIDFWHKEGHSKLEKTDRGEKNVVNKKVCYSRLRINICFFPFSFFPALFVSHRWRQSNLMGIFARPLANWNTCFIVWRPKLFARRLFCFNKGTSRVFIHVYLVIQHERTLFAVSKSQEVTPGCSVLVSIFYVRYSLFDLTSWSMLKFGRKTKKRDNISCFQ